MHLYGEIVVGQFLIFFINHSNQKTRELSIEALRPSAVINIKQVKLSGVHVEREPFMKQLRCKVGTSQLRALRSASGIGFRMRMHIHWLSCRRTCYVWNAPKSPAVKPEEDVAAAAHVCLMRSDGVVQLALGSMWMAWSLLQWTLSPLIHAWHSGEIT